MKLKKRKKKERKKGKERKERKKKRKKGEGRKEGREGGKKIVVEKSEGEEEMEGWREKGRRNERVDARGFAAALIKTATTVWLHLTNRRIRGRLLQV